MFISSHLELFIVLVCYINLVSSSFEKSSSFHLFSLCHEDHCYIIANSLWLVPNSALMARIATIIDHRYHHHLVWSYSGIEMSYKLVDISFIITFAFARNFQ